MNYLKKWLKKSEIINIVNSNDYLKMITKKKGAPKVCFAGIGYSVISPTGELYPCFPAMVDPKFKGMFKKNVF